jgi:hypothetical protein
MRKVFVFVAALVAVAALAGTAMAAKPDRLVIPIDDTFIDDVTCADELIVSVQGTLTVMVRFNKAGDVVAESQHPNIRITAINPTTGLTVTDRDVGLDKLTVNEDGTATILSTGIHSQIKGPDGKIVFRQKGLAVITLDANFNVISEEVHGNFDPEDAFAPAACAALGTGPA